MAGRPPKPTALKALAGNPGKRPLNQAEPKFEARVMRAPAHLSDEAKREWRRVSKELVAVGLLSVNPAWLHQGWMHAKLAFVAALLAYHAFCYRLMGQLQRGDCSWSGRQLRALNELPTLLLVVVVMLVVFKNQFPTGAATWLIVALVVFMAASIQFYARWRRLRAEREAEAIAAG